ncbi:MAG: S8 family peptidase [Flavobacteriaceae bacterium]|nr:S8 family peptidase [Flavobacteriaceae bacterium]
MRIIRSLSVAAIATLLLASCGATKNTTATVTKEIQIITATDSLVAKKSEMTEAEIQAWPHTDVFTDSIPGMSIDKAYNFVKDKQPTTVVVAVIDSGIDVEHEDLQGVIWFNEDEIANNGKDDDNNGYVDDVNGWNFLGGEKGQANPEQLELTRIVKKLTPKFEGKSEESIAEEDKADFELYTKLKKIIDDKKTSATSITTRYTMIKEMVQKANDTIVKLLAGKEMNLDNVNALNLEDQTLMQGKITVMRIIESGASVEDALNDIQGGIDYYNNQLKANYNVDFDGRLAGDNPYDITDTNYGNPYVIGSKDDEIHGTHVTGIIAAVRNNGVGMNGVTNHVKIMALRAVPDGDEYDKDVALAIRYAVDNGAKVVNMSFGKGHSPNAEWVYDAIKYAADHDVLLVHAAGNDGSDFDTEDNFPNDSKDKVTEFVDNVITVGAMTRHLDENIVASFSNYGKKNVDIFAPGLEIYSTFPKNEYESIQGTSMAAPEVAGVAALVRAYYPNLSASQVKHILMDSGIEFPREVVKPAKGGQTPQKVNFTELSVSGRVLNAYNALLLAEKMSKK